MRLCGLDVVLVIHSLDIATVDLCDDSCTAITARQLVGGDLGALCPDRLRVLDWIPARARRIVKTPLLFQLSAILIARDRRGTAPAQIALILVKIGRLA